MYIEIIKYKKKVRIAITSLYVGYAMNRGGERDRRYGRAYQYSRLGSDDLSSSDRINQTKSS